MKKRVAALFLATVMAVSVTACGSTPEQTAPAEGNEAADSGDEAAAESDGGQPLQVRKFFPYRSDLTPRRLILH